MIRGDVSRFNLFIIVVLSYAMLYHAIERLIAHIVLVLWEPFYTSSLFCLRFQWLLFRTM